MEYIFLVFLVDSPEHEFLTGAFTTKEKAEQFIENRHDLERSIGRCLDYRIQQIALDAKDG